MQEKVSTSSCLLALAAVAARHGLDLDANTLRRTFVIADQNPTSTALIAIAQEVGMEAKSIRPKWRELPKLQRILPAILILKDGGALVLDAILENTPSGQVAIVRDPAAPPEAQVALDQERLEAVWSGEVIMAKRRHAVTDESQPFSFRWLVGQVMREKSLFGEVAIAAVFSTFLGLVPAFAIMIIVDRVMVNRSGATLAVITGVIFFAIIFEMMLSFLRRNFMEAAATRIDARLNLYIMQKLLNLPMEYFERNATGLILSKLGQIGKIRNFLTGQLFTAFIDLILLLVLVPIMLILSWKLAMIIFVLVGIIVGIITMFLAPVGRLNSKVIQAEIQKSIYLTETIYGMRTIKTLAVEGRRRKEWDARVAVAATWRHAYGKLANWPLTLTMPFERLMYVGPFIVGAYISLEAPGSVAPGALMAFTMLAGRIGGPLIQIAKMMTDYGEVGSAVGEVAGVMNQTPENTRVGSGLRLPIHGDITFQEISFRYSNEAPLALDNAEFHIKPGTIFGIMGRSGSGKSTITRLIQGLNPSYKGVIKIDGMDLREIDLHHLRSSIGVVAQENFLFTGSVRENIGMARPDASFSDIVRAAQLAGAEEFIERLPRGYDTILQEGASNLSGGQRQRLAIARALVVDPPVLILDEATSALDAESEAIINANLMRIAQGRTIICVSHRLAMLVPSDTILVMEKGRVYDAGRHEELLQRCDIYKHMWYTQNRHSNPAGPPPNAPLTLAHSSAVV
jgi:ATP-binding cassette subfamily B protein